MNRRKATAFSAIAVVTAAVLIPAFAHEGHGKTESASWDPNAPKKVSPETALAIGLKTAEVDFGQVEEVMKLTGSVRARPDRLVAVSPRTAGIVRAITVQPGDSVKKGDTLAEIESQELAKNIYELRRLEADYERQLSDVKKSESLVRSLEIEVPATNASADLAEAEAARLTASGEAVSANLLAQRRTEAIKLRADAGLKAVALEQARTDVQSLRTQGASTQRSVEALRALIPPAQASDGSEVSVDAARPGLVRFLAPIDGVVVTRAAVVGQGVDAGAKVLTIGDFSTVQIEGEVPESLVDGLVAAGTPSVRVRRSNDGALVTTGTVRFISPVIDASKRTAHVIIDADNPGGVLRQGMFVELAVLLRQTDSAVVVPASAIVKEGPLQYVFVKEKEFFKKHDVATGARDDQIVEIKLGVAPGDVIAVQGAFSLSQLRGISPGTASEPAKTPDSAPAKDQPKPSSDGADHTHG